ncbi:hypothetical protein Baya_16137 [Bagarius yarrelli]|uniref:Uncharacterized protein n=1 Tax=Bagarius yarrelli TaxID=175774 RepID=A0A556VUK8_BAGYA|nr:hypothetical protein Baya_16137 [Bagarius yarrelli]
MRKSSNLNYRSFGSTTQSLFPADKLSLIRVSCTDNGSVVALDSSVSRRFDSDRSVGSVSERSGSTKFLFIPKRDDKLMRFSQSREEKLWNAVTHGADQSRSSERQNN